MTTLIKQRNPNPGESLMGLEKLDYVLFPECDTSLEIPQIRGKFNLGLTEDQQKTFEDYFGVKFETDEGKKWLSEYVINLRHDVNPRDHNKMEHLFDLAVLKANGGMGIVQFNDNEDEIGRFPFVATDQEKELDQKVNKKQLRNRGIEALENLSTNKTNLVKITKYIFDTGNTDLDFNLAYDKLDDYINGGQSAKFLAVLKLDPDYIDTVVTVKDAMGHGIIRLSADQWYVNYSNGTKLGRNLEEIIKYLNNPQNQDQLGTGSKDDTPYSIKRQLKEKIK